MKRSIEDRLLNPRPGSKAAAAKEFGIDLTLLIKNLRLTPQERVDQMQSIMRVHHELREKGRAYSKKKLA